MVNKWIKKGEEERYHAYGRGVKSVEYEMPDGETRDFAVQFGHASVGVLALTEDHQVLLARQFRPGPQRVLNELVGGAIDPGESPKEAALRELREETGHEGEVHYVGSFPHDAYNEVVRHYCVALGCREVCKQNLDEGEFVEVARVSLVDFWTHVRSGELTDVGGAYSCLDYLLQENVISSPYL